ncbi:MAG: hypothetical protein M1828_000752 [Chrysothrix sp. TS-e1954]|nr:MAG: hypothetical protein M1828_000752 [Chrysothrix sp. TS-e1954]
MKVQAGSVSSLVAALLTYSVSINASPIDLVERQDACASGVHIIAARGTNESTPNGTPGAVGKVANAIAARIPGTTIEGLFYPATAVNPIYTKSDDTGANHMKTAIKNYATRCPNTKIVLLGYSQGGEVTMDALCGQSSVGFELGPDPVDATQPLDRTYAPNINSVVVFGDPSHRANTDYDVGTSTHNGTFARQNLAACAPFRTRILSWCQANDKYCDSGDSKVVHHSYFKTPAIVTNATDFVVNKVNAAN